MSKRVLAFGTFDGLHKGHKFFLRAAKKLGDFLIVGLALDEHVFILKNKNPVYSLAERMKMVGELSLVDEVIACDLTLGSFEILRQTKPDVIAIGHDQRELHAALSKWMTEQELIVPMIQIKKL